MLLVEVFVSEEVFDLFPFEREDIRAYSSTVLKSNEIIRGDINVVFIGDKKMTELNTEYKKREGSTDVLSFDLSDESSDCMEGEVYVSLERAKKQALECNVPFQEEIIRLVTHGLLHLAGRTHKSEEDYSSMMSDTERYVRDFFNMEH